MGEVPTYWDCLWQQFRCLECIADLGVGSLQTHWQAQHNVVQGDQYSTPPPPQGGPSLTGLFTKDSGCSFMGVGGVPGEVKWDGPTSVSIFYTTTCGTHLQSWSKVTYPSPNAQNSTCLCPGGNLMTVTPPQRSSGGGRRANTTR